MESSDSHTKNSKKSKFKPHIIPAIEGDEDDIPKDPYPEIVDKIPDDDDKIIDIETLKWGGKPSQEAFDIAMDKINWSPHKIVFLEDKIENLERAQANHWNTILLDPKTPKNHKNAHFHFNHIQELIHEVIC